MTSSKTARFRLSVLSVGVVGLLAGIATPASAQQQPPQGWFKACTKQEAVDICNVQNIVTASNGQLVTGVSLIEIKGKVNRRVFQVTVPSGRLVPPGIGVQINGGKAQKLDYVVCFPDRCVAEAPLDDKLVGALKKGNDLTLTSVNFQNQPNPVKTSLQGFTGAYDGPALDTQNIADRQKQVQDYAKKNQDEIAKKLKEAQDAAKAAQ